MEKFTSVTLHAAVHLGQDYTENLRYAKNQPLKSLRQLFQGTERLITDQAEITRLTQLTGSSLCGERRLC